MKILELCGVSYNAISSNKFRTCLILLAIAAGIATVIIVIGISSLGRIKIEKELQAFGINSIWIWRDWQDGRDAKENFYSSNNEINNSDVQNIKIYFKELEYITPVVYSYIDVKFNRKSSLTGIIGTDENFLYANNDDMIEGRFLYSSDIARYKNVCVISQNIKEKLFDKDLPLGQNISIKGELFTIVGVLAKKDTPFLEMIQAVKGDNAGGIYIPVSVMQSWFKTNNINSLQALANSSDNRLVLERLKNYLSVKHNGVPVFKTESMQSYMNASSKIINILKAVFTVIALVSLFVSGLAIVNIMLMAVKERTKEIGIRKAVGARDKDIIFQFLTESAMISCIGGAIGIFTGVSILLAISKISGVSDIISAYSVAAAFFVSFFMGIAAGLYPAIQASKLDPIISLRYE